LPFFCPHPPCIYLGKFGLEGEGLPKTIVEGKINVGVTFCYFLQFGNVQLFVVVSSIIVELLRVGRLEQLTPIDVRENLVD